MYKWAKDLNRHFTKEEMHGQKSLKKCSSSLTRKIQIKTSIRYHFRPTKMTMHNNKCWQGYREMGIHRHCWQGCKMVQQAWKRVWQSLKYLNRVTLWPRNAAPMYIPKRTENICAHNNLYRNVHSNIFYNSQRPATTHVSTDCE